MRSSIFLAAIAATLLPSRFALADDWGCQVVLCLADPRGPEAESACVPPIGKLWTALRHGDPFPTCNFNSSSTDLPSSVLSAIPASTLANLGNGSGAVNVAASSNYCREDLLHWGGPEQSELLCSASGAINVTIDGTLFTRVWWDAPGQDSTIAEYYGTPMAGVPATAPYDPTMAAQQFMQLQNETDYGNSGGNGGGQ
ncbi:hypothetical protein [Paraburkholderia sp. GAS33]|uniref:hypothetical protein n=1 Tax=Paraburkholderia sp. GAS33 TaxID=3035130 RepID=UPI003D25DD2F